MRVLFSTYSVAFQNPGGGEKVLLKSAEALRELGHEVDVHSPWLHDLKNYDIIHYFSSLETGFWQASKDQCPNTPLFVTPTTWSFGKNKNYKIKKWLELTQPTWNRTIASRSLLPNHWLPTTQMEADVLMSEFGIKSKKVDVIPNGIEKHFFSPSPDQFRKWSGIEGDFALHIGRFHPVKNQLQLIRAFNRLGIPLVMIGGADIDRLQYYEECLAEANTPNSRVRILDQLPMGSDLLPSAYASAKIVVLPSEFETFGLVAFEAIAAKVPHILVTKNCAAKLDIGTSAEWIDPHNLDELAIRVQELITSKNGLIPDYSNSKILGWSEIGKKLENCYLRYL